jgi:hypothetical protein
MTLTHRQQIAVSLLVAVAIPALGLYIIHPHQTRVVADGILSEAGVFPADGHAHVVVDGQIHKLPFDELAPETLRPGDRYQVTADGRLIHKSAPQ